VMTKTSLTSIPPGESCECRTPDVDHHGRVLHLQTCPVCMEYALANVRGIEYARAYEKGVSRTVVQKELFSFSPYSRSGHKEVIPYGEPTT